MKDRLENYTWQGDKGMKKWQLTGYLDRTGLDNLFVQGKPLANGYYTWHPVYIYRYAKLNATGIYII